MKRLIPRSDSSRGELAGIAAALIVLLLLVVNLLANFGNAAPSVSVADRFGYLGLDNGDLGAFALIAAAMLASFGTKSQRSTRLVISFVAAVGVFLVLISIYSAGYVLIEGRSDLLGHPQYLLEDVLGALIGLLFGFGAVRIALPALKELRRPAATSAEPAPDAT